VSLAETVVIMPFYFREDTSPTLRRELMAAAVDELPRYVPPRRWVWVRDGAPWMAEDLEWLAARVGEATGELPIRTERDENQGKGGAVVRGLRRALEAIPEARAFAVLDGDGDHSPRDLPELRDLLATVIASTGNPLVNVVGRRVDRHGCLGFFRGELEGITNRVAFACLRYALARRGLALDETWVAPFGEADLEAGFRLYSREAAECVAAAYPRAVADWGESDLYRWGVEIVPTFEIALAGGVYAEGLRSTQETQPSSAYLAGVDPAHAYALEVRWMLRRAEAPVEASLLILQHALLRSQLRHLPEGMECLLRLEDLVREGLGSPREQGAPGLASPRRRL
jgi:hypothetical protein